MRRWRSGRTADHSGRLRNSHTNPLVIVKISAGHLAIRAVVVAAVTANMETARPSVPAWCLADLEVDGRPVSAGRQRGKYRNISSACPVSSHADKVRKRNLPQMLAAFKVTLWLCASKRERGERRYGLPACLLGNRQGQQ